VLASSKSFVRPFNVVPSITNFSLGIHDGSQSSGLIYLSTFNINCLGAASAILALTTIDCSSVSTSGVNVKLTLLPVVFVG
jgi:hypothetical protein